MEACASVACEGLWHEGRRHIVLARDAFDHGLEKPSVVSGFHGFAVIDINLELACSDF